VRFGFIAAEKATFPVQLLCRTLQVSRAGFYAWQARPAPGPSSDAGIRRHRQHNPGVYGTEAGPYADPMVSCLSRKMRDPNPALADLAGFAGYWRASHGQRLAGTMRRLTSALGIMTRGPRRRGAAR
jgi:hypothetical protein